MLPKPATGIRRQKTLEDPPLRKMPFPWIALGIGLLVGMVLVRTGATGPADARALPLLTQLLMAEFGFVLTAAGAFLGARRILSGGIDGALLLVTVACTGLSVGFLWLGLLLWPL
jgi:hypothetical protein